MMMKYKTRGLISVVELEDIIWRPTVPSCDNSSCRRHPSLSEKSVNLGLGMAVLDDLIAQVFKTLFFFYILYILVIEIGLCCRNYKSLSQSIGASGRAVI